MSKTAALAQRRHLRADAGKDVSEFDIPEDSGELQVLLEQKLIK